MPLRSAELVRPTQMKTNCSIVIVVLALACSALAQESASPQVASAPVKPESEMEKWIVATDAQWQAAFKRDVADVHNAELNKVKLQYLTALDDRIKKVSAAADLEGAVALRNEQNRITEAGGLPAQDEPGDATILKQIRMGFRAQFAQAQQSHSLRLKALHAKYDQTLAQAQAQLTRYGRLDDALLVKAKRDEVAGMWLSAPKKTQLPSPAPIASAPKSPLPPPAPAAPAAHPEPADGNLIVNGTFEKGTESWDMFNSNTGITRGVMTADMVERHDGKPTLRIENGEGAATWVRQAVSVKPYTWYRLTGYIKTKDVQSVNKDQRTGAMFMMGMGFVPDPVQGTQSWRKVSIDFAVKDVVVAQVGPAMGGFGAPVAGTAWFSEMSLTELGSNAKK